MTEKEKRAGERVKYPYTQVYMLKEIKKELKDKGELLLKNLPKRICLPKGKADEWLRDSITRKDFKDDDRLYKVLHKWYNSLGIVVSSTDMFQKELKRAGVDMPLNTDILLLRNQSAVFKEMKFGKYKKKQAV